MHAVAVHVASDGKHGNPAVGDIDGLQDVARWIVWNENPCIGTISSC